MSHTLNAIDSENVHYLLLDCTNEEKDQLNSYFLFNIFNPLKVNQLKKVVASLNQSDLNALPFGMLKRNLVNLMGLTELDDIVAVSCEYDTSNPTSDYRYPVASFTPEDCDEDDEHQMLHLTITDVAAYDAFMNTPTPWFNHHSVIKLGEINSLRIFLGKTTDGRLFLYSLDESGTESSDLSYTIS